MSNKEILTVAECRDRLLEANKITSSVVGAFIIVWILGSVITCGPLSLIVLFFLSNTEKMFFAMYIMIGGICALPAILLFIFLIKDILKSHKLYKRILHADIEIVEDTLLRAYQDCRTHGKGSKLYYVLDFQNHGKYKLPEHQHYTWSELYTMSYRGIYNTAISGDTFYIVRLKDKRTRKPIEVYNAKHFELCPDGTERKPLSSWRDSVSLE